MKSFIINLIEMNIVLGASFSFLLMVILAFIPAMPIPLVASIIGNIFSIPVALTINLGGNVLGSCLMFLLSRTSFKKFAEQKMNKWKSVTGFFLLLERNGFLAVLIARLIPIMPSAAINLIVGISNISMTSFILATIIGKFPTMLAATIAGSQFNEHPAISILLFSLYFCVLIIIGYKLKKHWTYKNE
ncbi:TVP38/TMEM64 family protein [Lysinibacillus sp. 54212]|uniref:TVP38/TMEM64 family protein n=1 Tax=Lysinibacillus sp. 54212 TaxID=3119829 RepID=UPI002FC73725